MARNLKPHKWTWGETTVGIIPLSPGRWRISSTGERFTEHNEYQAYLHFKKSQNGASDEEQLINQHAYKDVNMYWEFVREQIIKNPVEAAAKLRIPQIAHLDLVKLPADPIKLSAIAAWYEQNSPAKPASKRLTIAAWNKMLTFCEAKTIADITTDKLRDWRTDIVSNYNTHASQTAFFDRVRTIIKFARRDNMDVEQINNCLERMKVLWTATPRAQLVPTPISREDFHTLYNAATGDMKTIILLGLNFCMHLSEVLELKWSEIDLTAGTYVAIRGKTSKHRIPRAATLFPETIEALKKLPHTGEYVFTSKQGSHFKRTGKTDGFRRLADSLGLKSLTFDWLRDGAYTAASRANGVDDKWARLLAGHRAPGLADNYVLRSPEAVKPACDAVYKAYFA